MPEAVNMVLYKIQQNFSYLIFSLNNPALLYENMLNKELF